MSDSDFTSGFRIVLGSPIDYEELVVYVYVGNEQVAIVSKEEGPSKVKVELFGAMSDKETNKVVDFELFVKALLEAKTWLLND